jgi:hypothetical protein
MCRLGLMSGGLGNRDDDDFVPRPVVTALIAPGPTTAAEKSTGLLAPASTTATLVALATMPRSRVVRGASVAAWRRCSGSEEDALGAIRCGHDVVLMICE